MPSVHFVKHHKRAIYNDNGSGLTLTSVELCLCNNFNNCPNNKVRKVSFMLLPFYLLHSVMLN